MRLDKILKRSCLISTIFNILSILSIIILGISFNISLASTLTIKNTPAAHFYVIPLGTSGGELEDNLSSYLLAPVGSNDWIAMDAGTLCGSLKKIPITVFDKVKVKPLPNKTQAETFLSNYLKDYLISHAHLDHINGMVICSTIDTHKNILGINSTINYLRDYIFNWKIWPNFADMGQKPWLNKYHYQKLTLESSVPIPQTSLMVTPFLLNHSNGYPSTAFLLKSKEFYLLYMGDTGADALEHSNDLHKLWLEIAPLIKAHKLTAIFIEASFPNEQPDNLLFGHLTPHELITELHQLAMIVNPSNPQTALTGLKVVVTHTKQGLENKNMLQEINQQLNKENDLNVQFIIPKPEQLLIF